MLLLERGSGHGRVLPFAQSDNALACADTVLRMGPNDKPQTGKPQAGKIVIEWKRLPEPYESFDWHVDLESAGLPDEDMARLLAEIAASF